MLLLRNGLQPTSRQLLYIVLDDLGWSIRMVHFWLKNDYKILEAVLMRAQPKKIYIPENKWLYALRVFPLGNFFIFKLILLWC